MSTVKMRGLVTSHNYVWKTDKAGQALVDNSS